MVKRILTGAGFIEDESFKETRFLNPPAGTYAIYLDSFTRRGADSANYIKEHYCTIELYSEIPDPDAEARIEAQLDANAVEYEKEARYWIEEEQLFQVVYTFEHTEK